MFSTPDDVDRLIAFFKTFDGCLYASPMPSPLEELGVKSIIVESQSIQLKLPVFDEWQDVERASQVLLLHLIIQACEYYEDAENFEEWRVDIELPDTLEVRLLYSQLSEEVPKARKIFGYELMAISDFDLQLNTGMAKKLREVS